MTKISNPLLNGNWIDASNINQTTRCTERRTLSIPITDEVRQALASASRGGVVLRLDPRSEEELNRYRQRFSTDASHFNPKRVENYDSGPQWPNLSIALKIGLTHSDALVVQGPTGSGKSSALPMALALQSEILSEGSVSDAEFPVVWISQPTRVAAVQLALYLSTLCRQPVGTLIGFAVGQESRFTAKTRIIYSTPGFMHRFLGNCDALSESELKGEAKIRCTHLILDEVHIKNAETELLMIYGILAHMRKKSEKQPKLLIMSATLRFNDYGPRIVAGLPGHRVSYIKLQAQRFPVTRIYAEKKFLKHASSEFELPLPVIEQVLRNFSSKWWSCGNEVKGIRASTPSLESGHITAIVVLTKFLASHGDVLVFLPGISQLNAVADAFSRILPSTNSGSEFRSGDTLMFLDKSARGGEIMVSLLHASAFERPGAITNLPRSKSISRVYLATTVAENSITIPELKFVVDLGLCRDSRNAADIDVGSSEAGGMITRFCTADEIQQRRGRVGRTSPGIIFHLYPRSVKKVSIDAETRTVKLSVVGARSVLLGSIACAALRSQQNLKMIDIIQAMTQPVQLSKAHAILRAAVKARVITISSATTDEDVLNIPLTGFNLTQIGRFSATLPISFLQARLLAAGMLFGCLPDALIVVATLSVPDFCAPAIATGDKDVDLQNTRAFFSFFRECAVEPVTSSRPFLCQDLSLYDTHSDVWGARNMMVKWLEHESSMQDRSEWATRNGLSYRRMETVQREALFLAQRLLLLLQSSASWSEECKMIIALISVLDRTCAPSNHGSVVERDASGLKEMISLLFSPHSAPRLYSACCCAFAASGSDSYAGWLYGSASWLDPDKRRLSNFGKSLLPTNEVVTSADVIIPIVSSCMEPSGQPVVSVPTDVIRSSLDLRTENSIGVELGKELKHKNHGIIFDSQEDDVTTGSFPIDRQFCVLSTIRSSAMQHPASFDTVLSCNLYATLHKPSFLLSPPEGGVWQGSLSRGGFHLPYHWFAFVSTRSVEVWPRRGKDVDTEHQAAAFRLSVGMGSPNDGEGVSCGGAVRVSETTPCRVHPSSMVSNVPGCTRWPISHWSSIPLALACNFFEISRSDLKRNERTSWIYPSMIWPARGDVHGILALVASCGANSGGCACLINKKGTRAVGLMFLSPLKEENSQASRTASLVAKLNGDPYQLAEAIPHIFRLRLWMKTWFSDGALKSDRAVELRRLLFQTRLAMMSSEESKVCVPAASDDDDDEDMVWTSISRAADAVEESRKKTTAVAKLFKEELTGHDTQLSIQAEQALLQALHAMRPYTKGGIAVAVGDILNRSLERFDDSTVRLSSLQRRVILEERLPRNKGFGDFESMLCVALGCCPSETLHLTKAVTIPSVLPSFHIPTALEISFW